MVDLKARPYYLSDEDIAWVENTIAGMTDEEKVGQLFFQLTASREENYLKELMEKYHLGGCRYNPAPGAAVQAMNRTLQKYAKVPLFIACNTEAGGDGACADGTHIGAGIKIGATGSGKSWLDYAVVIPKRLLALKGEGAAVLLGNTQGTLSRNILDPMRDIWGEALVGTISSDNTVRLFGRRVHVLGADNKKHVARIQGAAF